MHHAIVVWYNIVAVAFSFIAGSAIGSGIMCLLMRRATHRSWLKGRSACDACGHTLAWYDLIPVVSYLCSGGKCRYCGANIPASCLTSELVYGLLGAVFGMTLLYPATPTLLRLLYISIAGVTTIVYTIYSYHLLTRKEGPPRV